MPDTIGMGHEEIIALNQRYLQRINEFRDLSHEMRMLQSSGDIRIENGVVIEGSTGKAFTGDHDIFRIIDSVTGKEIPADSKLYKRVVSDLMKPPLNAQHPAHTQWKYNPLDPEHGKLYRTVDQSILNEHTPRDAGGKGKALVNFGPGNPPATSFYHGEVDRWGLPD
jgi:hypothetical protein